jgi:hypothetical protein
VFRTIGSAMRLEGTTSIVATDKVGGGRGESGIPSIV